MNSSVSIFVYKILMRVAVNALYSQIKMQIDLCANTSPISTVITSHLFLNALIYNWHFL